MAPGEVVAVIKAMQQGAQDIEFLLQHRVGLMGIDGRLAPSFAGGVLLDGALELVGDPDVIDHQPALLVLEHPVHPCNRLHQVVALHRLVHIEGMHAGRIEAGQPHITHDDQLERVTRVFEPLLQPFLDQGWMNMGAQQRLVRGAAGHHDLDGPLVGVRVMPVGAQGYHGIIQVHADLAAHGHHHRLAMLCLIALFKVGHQIGGHPLDPGLAAYHLLQGGPA